VNQIKSKLTPPAFYGLAGEVVKELLPHTEADEAALLAQILVCFGNAINRTAYFTAEASKHHTNLYIIIVGLSGKGRKGSSLNQIKQLFEFDELEGWRKTSFAKGLSSGEGLIDRVKDVVRMEAPNIQVMEDVDKRLLCIETEFGNVLQVMKRNGNTLSVVLRDAWDGSTLSTLTKNSPLKATDPHISFIGHITFEELKTSINPVDIKNGLGNRFIYFCSDRSKELPEGLKLEPEKLRRLQEKIKDSYLFVKALGVREIPFTDKARELWIEKYSTLSNLKMGIHGDLSGRAEAQVRRIALILSLMNKESEVSLQALEAAFAIWNYSSDSIKYIWGTEFGNSILDKILAILENFGEMGRTRSELIKDCHNNYAIGRQLDYLEGIGLIVRSKKQSSGAKPIACYHLLKYQKTSEINELHEL
jgi:hypothetical protein